MLFRTRQMFVGQRTRRINASCRKHASGVTTGLVPKQHSRGGKARRGKMSKMGQRDIRTLPVSGAMAVLQAVERFGTPDNRWLTRLRSPKPRMVAAIALANKMARGLWAMMTHQEDYPNPVATMARAHCAFHSALANSSRYCGRVRRSLNSKGKGSTRSRSENAVFVLEPTSPVC